MNLTLIRNAYSLYGIWGELVSDDGSLKLVTLEHSYPVPGGYEPKLPLGTYTCQRGQHRLAKMNNPFTTFEIVGVPGHTNILFHRGNYNDDSDGCLLVGLEVGTICILESAKAFDQFMAFQEGVDQFMLTVIDDEPPVKAA